MNSSSISEEIKKHSLDIGFSKVGIAQAKLYNDDKKHLKDWISKGYNSEMKWMERNTEKRSNVFNYYPEVKYVHNKIDVVSNLGTFPVLSSEIEPKVKLIPTQGYTSLNEFIDYGKNEGLTHIIADENENRPQFLKDVFKNEEKFLYLTKIYDSVEQGYDYHLKIFRIDYEKFESIEFN